MPAARSSTTTSGAYVILPESYFADGSLVDERTQPAALLAVLERVFEARTRQGLTSEVVRSECCMVRASREQAEQGLPAVSLYHRSLPLVRLYRRGERYEVHALRPDCTLADLMNVVTFDEVFHNKVPANPPCDHGVTPEAAAASRQPPARV